jgi:hypothetical protein
MSDKRQRKVYNDKRLNVSGRHNIHYGKLHACQYSIKTNEEKLTKLKGETKTLSHTKD